MTLNGLTHSPFTIMLADEEQPLLATNGEDPANKFIGPTWQTRTARFLESPLLHKIVITLVSRSFLNIHQTHF